MCGWKWQICGEIYLFFLINNLVICHASVVRHDLHITHAGEKKNPVWNKRWQQQTSARRVDARKLLSNLRHGALPPATVSSLRGVSLELSFWANVIGVPLDSKMCIIFLDVTVLEIIRNNEDQSEGPDWIGLGSESKSQSICKLASQPVKKKIMHINTVGVKSFTWLSTMTYVKIK